MAKVRFTANERPCISNMRQISLALNLYRQDYDGSETGSHYTQLGLPEFNSFDPTKMKYPTTNSKSFDAFVATYLKNRSVLFCPLSSPSFKNNLSNPKSYTLYNQYIHGYANIDTGSEVWRVTNFAMKYANDPIFPVVICDFHDFEYESRRHSDNPKPNEDLIGVSLSGTTTRRKWYDVYPGNSPANSFF